MHFAINCKASVGFEHAFALKNFYTPLWQFSFIIFFTHLKNGICFEIFFKTTCKKSSFFDDSITLLQKCVVFETKRSFFDKKTMVLFCTASCSPQVRVYNYFLNNAYKEAITRGEAIDVGL